MAKSTKEPNYDSLLPRGEWWEAGEKFAKMQDAMSKPAFTRFLYEDWSRAGGSVSTAYRWISRYRALAFAIPYELPRKALAEVTRGKGLVTSGEGPATLSSRYVAALRKCPVPVQGTSFEDCLDWARQVQVVAEHFVESKAAAESWQVQTAKARFSEVFRRARTEGPQRITKQGKEGVMMIAEEQYDRLIGKARQPKNLVQFFRQSPLVGVDLDLDRSRDTGRDIDL